MGWDPLKESLCEYVQRQRIEEHMGDGYDDLKERKMEQRKALCLWWARSPKARPATLAPRVFMLQLALWPVTVHDENQAA